MGDVPAVERVVSVGGIGSQLHLAGGCDKRRGVETCGRTRDRFVSSALDGSWSCEASGHEGLSRDPPTVKHNEEINKRNT